MFGTLSPRDKIVKAKLQLRKRNPFFSGLAQYLEPIEDRSIESIAVDGLNDKLYYNPKWMDTIESKDILNEMVHNILHKALGHTNKEYNNKAIGNLAKDIKVDNLMNNEGFGSYKSVANKGNTTYLLSENTAEISIRTDQDKTETIKLDNIDKGFVEQLYGKMSHINIKSQENKDHDKHSKTSNKDSGKRESKKWARRMQQSGMQAGVQSAELQRIINALSEPNIDWNDIFRDKITGYMITDYTWSKPSRLFYTLGIYLPGYVRENFKLLIGIDTSGSVSQKQFSTMISEIYAIYEQHNDVEIEILIGDTKLTEHLIVTSTNREDILATKITGGGGTSHTFYKEWIEENDWNGDVLVLMTDGYSNIEPLYDQWDRSFDTVFIYDKTMNPSMENYGTVVYMDKL